MSALLGTLGIVAIEGSYVPQIVRLYRLKHAEDVSVFFPSLNLFGRALAVAYSITQGQSVFVFGFAFGIVLRAVLLSQVLYYRRLQRRREPARAAPPARVAATPRGEPAQQT